MRHKDGRWLVIELSSVSHLQDPSLACVFTILNDVTNQSQLEKDAAASEAHYRALVENADDLLLCYDPKSGLRVENPAALGRLGLPPIDLASSRALELIHPEDLPAAIHAVERALKEADRPQSVQVRLRGVDGRWHHFEGRGRGLSGHNSVLVTLRDVTDARAVQKQLVRYERLAAIGQTASGLAHEVRNPLAVVSATAEYLRGQSADRPSVQRDLDGILEAVDRIRSLVSDVLERSRDRELKPVAVPADQLLDQACKAALLRYGPASERVQVLRSFGSPPPKLKVDLGQMDRVVTNLVLNALQAMHGDGSLTLSAAVDGKQAVLEVADNGPGIPEGDLPKVFEPFFTTKEQGSGLGLWICKTIVEEHGGLLEVRNLQPRGCAFSIRLPLEAA
jgi:PAS domain S-box-containing protein